MTELAIVEGEVVESSTSTGLTLYDPHGPTGSEVIARASEKATALAEVIEQRQLYSVINKRRHVLVEGWTLLGSMMGVFPVAVSTERLVDEQGGFLGFAARVEARTIDGAVVGAANARCLRSEGNWKSRDEFAIESMAQTRATSKALRMPLGFVMQLAGFDPAPAEEMGDVPAPKAKQKPKPAPAQEEPVAEPQSPEASEQLARGYTMAAIFAAGREVGLTNEKIKKRAYEKYSVSSMDDLSDEQLAEIRAALLKKRASQ